MKLLGLCGSLRAASTNARLLVAATRLLPAGATLQVSTYPAKLPHFNPDIPFDSLDVVRDWASEMKSAPGVILSTPEYARGYPGSLKNALDWLVNTDAFVQKPFMFLNASDRSNVGRESLTVVLETMSGIHVAHATLTLPLLGRQMEAEDILADSLLQSRIRTALQAFVADLESRT